MRARLYCETVSQPARLPAAVGLPVALAAGIAIPAQSRINGALGTALDDSLAAALVSFGVGLAVMNRLGRAAAFRSVKATDVLRQP